MSITKGIKGKAPNKKTTVNKIMTLKDYITLGWRFECENEPLPDFGQFCPEMLAEKQKYSFRLTDEQKEYFDKYFEQFTVPGGIKLLVAGLPRISGGLVVTPHQTVKVNPTPAVVSAEPAVDKMPASIDQIDIKGMVESLERGEMKVKKLVVMLEEQYGSANKIMSALVPGEIKRMRRQYKDCPDILNVFIIAEEIVCPKVKDILSEPEPPIEETMQRFQKHTLYSKKESKNSKVIEYAASCDKIDSIEGKRITFDLDFEKFVDYANAEDMKEDVLYLVNAGKIKIDQEVDIFGKSTSGAKTIAKIYKKYPNGAPGAGLFFSSRKEAFLAGQLEI